jgi:phospholipid/cholesterol/gamma-HCH transport system ATP-binding protein
MHHREPETNSNPPVEFIDASIPALESLNKSIVLENVNWVVNPFDYWIIGALPGTGKSDLLATAAALQKVTEGRHLLFGRDLAHLHPDELVQIRQRMGMVFENGGRLFSQLTVAENLALPICYHRNCSAREAAAQVKATLDLTELTPFADTKPNSIVRTMHQRIGLARALVLNPEILLLDNPLTSMDPRQTFWWVDFLAKLSAGHPKLDGRKLTLVVATDDLRPWTDQGTKFAVIRKKQWLPIGGRVELQQSQETILRELLASDFAPI